MLLGKTSPRLWLILMVFVFVTVLCESSKHKNSSETNQRADDDNSNENDHDKKSKLKAVSSDNSDSEADKTKKEISKEELNKAGQLDDSSDEDNDADDHGKLQSTRGLKPEDFEPEDGPKGLAKHEPGSDDETDGGSKRRKRSIHDLNIKNINKNVDKFVVRKLENQ